MGGQPRYGLGRMVACSPSWVRLQILAGTLLVLVALGAKASCSHSYASSPFIFLFQEFSWSDFKLKDLTIVYPKSYVVGTKLNLSDFQKELHLKEAV